MIKLNGKTIEGKKFPDGTLSIFDFPIESIGNSVKIEWQYENDNEFFLLFCCVKHIKQNFKNTEIVLNIPYVYGARMDRTKSNEEVFTLKYFANFINSLNLDKVVIFDPHSDVTPALMNNVQVINPEQMILNTIDVIKKIDTNHKLVIYFPDYGAKKRYGNYFKGYDIVFGIKNRDWNTGKILGIDICDSDGINLNYSVNFKDVLKDKTVLMVDDIVSYGGTLAYSADKLKEFECGDIYAYVSHTENSVLNEEKCKLLERLKNGTVKKVFTTDSLYTGNSEYIDVIYNFF